MSAATLVTARSTANLELVGPGQNVLFSDHSETVASWAAVKQSLLFDEMEKSEVLETFRAVVGLAKFDLQLALLKQCQSSSESFAMLP